MKIKNKDDYDIEKKRRLIDSYTIVADEVPAKINIFDIKEENVPLYEIVMPKIEVATEAFIQEMMDELAQLASVSIEDITDPRKVEILKKTFFDNARKVVSSRVPELSRRNQQILAGLLLQRMYGLDFVDVIMADDFIEEITINGSKFPVSVYHKKHGWLKTSKFLKNEEEIYNFSSQIGRKVGRDINSLNPIMDAYLISGDRVAATLFPISTQGNTITIRRFARTPWTPVHLIDPSVKSCSADILAVLWQAIQYELNIIVTGGTATGKTSMLNALCSFMPPNQRIISIEDTREIQLPKPLHWNWVPLTSRNPNPEGQGAVSMLDLMVSSLRMRPDRIVVGEVRRKEQAEAMFEAMHTGHSVYSTMHADTVYQLKRRLLEPPMQIPKSEAEALHFVLTQYRDRRRGLRRSLELAEVLTGGEKDLEVNYLYRWRVKTDTFEKVGNSTRLMEELNLLTGMTPDEQKTDIDDKKKILHWMLANNIKNIDEVGEVMKIYYKYPEHLVKSVKRNEKPERVL